MPESFINLDYIVVDRCKMKELTKPKYSTVRMRIEDVNLLKAYRDLFGFHSLGEALRNALYSAYQYQKMAYLTVKKEIGV